MTELNKKNSRANSRPNTTPRFMHLQRRRIPYAAEPRANRAIATAISQQRIDHPSPRGEKGRRRNRRELRQRASIAAPCAPESPSVVRRRPKHSSMFHIKQIYFYGSKTVILHNTPHFKHRLALLHSACSAPFMRSFKKHITSSAHNPHTFFARYMPFDTKAHWRQPNLFEQPHHMARAYSGAIHAFDHPRRTSRPKPTPSAAPTSRTKPTPSATCYNKQRNRRERFSQTECRSIDKLSPLARFTHKILDKH